LKLISIKKNKDKSYHIDGNSYFIAGLFLFILLFVIGIISSLDFYLSFIFSIIFSGFIIIIVIINNFFGKRKHQSIHKSRLFQEIYNDSFKEEKFGDYIGVLKTHKERTIRIYYEWSKQAKGFLSFGDIVINVFFKPLSIDYQNIEIYEDQLIELNNKYNKKRKKGTLRFFMVDRIVTHINYYPWIKLDTINKQIRESCLILNQEYLEPFNIDHAPSELKDHKKNGVFFPNMELVWDELEKNTMNL